MLPSSSRTVWYSKGGDLRKQVPRKPAVQSLLPHQQQTASLHRDSKGRAGKGVIEIQGGERGRARGGSTGGGKSPS